MLISHMEAAKELVGITADTCSYTKVAVVVTSTHYTWLVGCTYTPSIVVSPKGFRTDMTTRLAFIPFEIAIDKVFPGIVVLSLMFPRQGGIKSILIEKSHAKGDTVAVGLSNS
jgi:hypothetical protein